MKSQPVDPRRAIPSVHALIESDAVKPLLDRAPRSLVADAVRQVVDRIRLSPQDAPSDDAGWTRAVETMLADRTRPSLVPVFNATGTVLHTNLGRAPLAAAAIAAIGEIAAGYSNLEYDIALGERGSRYDHCVRLLTEVTGAEDAIIVNNCAAALVLVLDTVAGGRESIVSRGELIEIGGSFRVPDIMAKSGTRLVEVGTTNRTYAADYERAITDQAAAIVKVHRSNFRIEGFVAEATLNELAKLASSRGLVLVHDFGSGLLLSLDRYGLTGEPTARETLSMGAHLTVMSGDKLLGGPQAGIILGERRLISRLRSNPLCRALRVDKLTIAALGATLALYREPERAVSEIPVLAMLTAPVASVRKRAGDAAERLGAARIGARVVPTTATVGGGAFPTASVESAAIELATPGTATEARLRGGPTAIIGRISDDHVLLDMRTIPERDDEAFVGALLAALA